MITYPTEAQRKQKKYEELLIRDTEIIVRSKIRKYFQALDSYLAGKEAALASFQDWMMRSIQETGGEILCYKIILQLFFVP